MAMFVVIHAHGAPWDTTRSLREQEAWDQHAAFMGLLEIASLQSWTILLERAPPER
jgi:hypothetical protein